ncbi:hypothetical protein [Prescottella equi]|uniref:hypothetical protein n=1 Tax=Rhodococcus hoagii TaxID=43767 RepID=UPI001584D95B|nr:hypothetical protein [Prescottella equi]
MAVMAVMAVMAIVAATATATGVVGGRRIWQIHLFRACCPWLYGCARFSVGLDREENC